MNAWLHYGGGLELWRELYEPFNLIPFAAGGIPVCKWPVGLIARSIQWMISSGLRMRIPGLGGEVIYPRRWYSYQHPWR